MEFKGYETNFRNLVVGVDTKVPIKSGGYVTAINFDNAATTPPFQSVMNEINKFSPWYSSIHRGTGYKSLVSSHVYDNSRKQVLDFVNADGNYYTAIYVKNTTEAINKIAYRLCSKTKKCVILSTSMEHHSNDLPWRNKYIVDYISIDKSGRLDLNDLERKLIKYKGKVKLVTITGASNVTGFKNPIYKAAELAHKHNAQILVDGAQLIPHASFSMGDLKCNDHIDFLVFSAHKMYAPFGIGVLIAPKYILKDGPPELKGGGTVKFVTHDLVQWDDPPNKEEAGSPNIMGVVALVTSINTIKSIGMEKLEKHEEKLTEYALTRIKDISGIQLYGNTEDCKDRVSIIPFNIEGIPHSVVARALSDEAGIAVRSGCFCAHPYVQKLLNIPPKQIEAHFRDSALPKPGMIRLSFGLYNDFKEIDRFIKMLDWISNNKNYYIREYSDNLNKHR
jgi:cysteine desulfurase / selenocysteine lyase